MKQTKRTIFSYVAMALALALLVGTTVVFIQEGGNASAEAVEVAQKATIVESPFTQAVREVRDSVVGVNNYGHVSPNNYFYGPGGNFGFGFGFGGGRGFGGSVEPEQEEEKSEEIQGSGSGVVIASGYVLTNHHVIDGAISLEVTAGEDKYKATLVGFDEALDIAVLKVEGLKIKPVTLGDSDLLNVGDWAICIGNPLSFTGTTTVGVISGLDREMDNETTDIYGLRTKGISAMIQTDAAINAGNSGGGMFNVAGELVGIPSRKYAGTAVEGIGMAIPINAAKPLIEDALSGKALETKAAAEDEKSETAAEARPRIGVTASNLDASSYLVAMGLVPTGAYIVEVESGSPAEKAGMKAGDIVVEVDGTIVKNANQMTEILREKKAGETAAIKLYRIEGLEDAKRYEDIEEGEYIDMTIELAILDNIKQ